MFADGGCGGLLPHDCEQPARWVCREQLGSERPSGVVQAMRGDVLGRRG